MIVVQCVGGLLKIVRTRGAACGFAGMYLSYYVDAASGATIVLVAAGVFVAVFALTAVLNRRRLARVGSEMHAGDVEGSPAFDLH